VRCFAAAVLSVKCGVRLVRGYDSSIVFIGLQVITAVVPWHSSETVFGHLCIKQPINGVITSPWKSLILWIFKAWKELENRQGLCKSLNLYRKSLKMLVFGL